MDRVLAGLGLGAVLGGIGGGILAFPFWFFGVIVGVLLAAPVGLAIGIVCAIKKWRLRAVVISCLGQFVGALVFGVVGLAWTGQVFRGLHWTLDSDVSADAPFWGQIIGAAIGLLVASACSPRIIPPGHCSCCGYNLTGNVSGVCPECGTKL